MKTAVQEIPKKKVPKVKEPKALVPLTEDEKFRIYGNRQRYLEKIITAIKQHPGKLWIPETNDGENNCNCYMINPRPHGMPNAEDLKLFLALDKLIYDQYPDGIVPRDVSFGISCEDLLMAVYGKLEDNYLDNFLVFCKRFCSVMFIYHLHIEYEWRGEIKWGKSSGSTGFIHGIYIKDGIIKARLLDDYITSFAYRRMAERAGTPVEVFHGE